ncbi:MAG TPA: hypothetical protein VF121_03195 [Thermoanaerobaculia bacterium]|nr:hypothetical protein [Thermoanaerobaculia bacterium]
MNQERIYPSLDAVHAVLIATYDATRFLKDPDLDGIVGRLRRAAAAANTLTLHACREMAAGRGLEELVHARSLLREMGEVVALARREGLDHAAASELLEYQSHASLTLGALAEELRAAALAA